MTRRYVALVAVLLLPCGCVFGTNQPPDHTWSLVDYLDPSRPVPAPPSDEALSQVPQRMLELRAGMTTAQFWKTLGIDPRRVRDPRGSIRYWYRDPIWAHVDLGHNRQYKIQVKLDPRNVAPSGVRIRQTNVAHWIECDLGELTEQQRAQQSATFEMENRGQRRALMDLMQVSSNAVIHAHSDDPQQEESQHPPAR